MNQFSIFGALGHTFAAHSLSLRCQRGLLSSCVTVSGSTHHGASLGEQGLWGHVGFVLVAVCLKLQAQQLQCVGLVACAMWNLPDQGLSRVSHIDKEDSLHTGPPEMAFSLLVIDYGWSQESPVKQQHPNLHCLLFLLFLCGIYYQGHESW